ncbi:RNA polymerase sigma factor [Propioniciclava soli]|uniref:Sigma-70 family RNA polymerase sigma factor n=1 Tax=Propioniciclava soli TaxID=2775081 RepID=A0ABZ3C6I0_9ACTN|nr:hypothetical protein [Propioniciclava soli]
MTAEHWQATARAWDAEWERLAPPGRTVPTAWLLACPVLTPATWVCEVADVVRTDPDAVLLALLRLHRTGDTLAGQAVLRAMTPKAVRMAARDAEAGLADYLAALWERIATYPVERRPTRVAANLALDALKTVKSARACRPTHAWAPVAEQHDPLVGDAVLDAGLRLGVIDAQTRRTLACVYVEGHSSADAARELGTSSDAVRWRCSKGVRALRAHAGDLVAELVG